MRKDTEKDLDNLTDAYMEEWAGEIIFLVLIFYSILFFDLAYLIIFDINISVSIGLILFDFMKLT